MRKIKRLVLHETSHVLSSKDMMFLFGGTNVLIYSCVCSKDGSSNKSATIKVTAGTDPESAILGSNGACYGYTYASCAYRTTV
ncbi:MAG: TIGR04149 family rSAM-modified RiPP [Prevotella sp.]|uniref:TIGR04149 family rSAM-modified RiPP n=1 Tax=Hallella sp. TaxID=2980186 RepID=UPI00338D64FD